MSRKVARPGKRNQEKSKQKSRRGPVAILGTLLILTLAVGAMAQWKILPGPGKPLALAPASAQPGSFNADSPSKEYIYAGGRLIATEEPTPTASPGVTPSPTPSSASGSTALFVRTDTSTKGNWKGRYGADGYNVIGDSQSYPSYAQVTPAGFNTCTWASSTTDGRALQRSANSLDRVAACLYQSTSFTIDVNLTDGQTHQLALYFVDWDGQDGRSQQVQVLDPTTNAVLDSRSLSSFSNGQYMVWRVRGHLLIRLTQTGISNAVLSGIFFDQPSRINYALSANGGVASATSQNSAGFPVSAVNNGDRFNLYQPDSNYNLWHSAAGAAKPDLVEVAFNGQRTIDEIDVVTFQDNYTAPVDPTEATTFTTYGITDFSLQYWDGAAWQAVPNASATGNNKVWRRFTFPEITTAKIRLKIDASVDGYSRVTELEAWGYAAPSDSINVALSASGSIATASSIYSAGSYPPSAAINGDRRGLNWGSGGGWNDVGPAYSFPDWLEVDFQTERRVREVYVFTGQDAYWGPAEPTPSMTFNYYGLTEFKVQYWTGTGWADIPAASTTGNNLVWKKFTFAEITTQKIRVWCTGSADGWSRITEVEAWGN